MNMRHDQNPHISVLLEDSVSHLITNKSGIYIDCTLGFGGHALKILDRINKNGKLIGIDFDPYALEYSKIRLEESNTNFELHLSNYTKIKEILAQSKIQSVDGILFDLGISSHQVDSGYKGLSYRKNHQLDMWMDSSAHQEKSLREILYNNSGESLANIIFKYGDERGSRKISNSIKEYIKKGKMENNEDLVNAISKVVPKRYINKTLSRVFQAFRIEVNNELDKIFNSICDAIYLLKKGGRLVIITFHSIEDRIIKNIFKSFSKGDKNFIEKLGYDCNNCEKLIKIVNKKPIAPTWDEIKKNKRSRSAKLRVVERI